jgi:5-methyltetrahydropteroyltriglutamate--homocysteine methyltransferase
MSSSLFPTQEIGSLPKAPWLLSYLRGKKLEQIDLDHLEKWSNVLEFECKSEALTILNQPKTKDNELRLRQLASLFGIRFLESSGLDIVYDGEANRIEMYEHAIRNADGFEFYGRVRSFDNRYYRKAACVQKVGFRVPYHLDEFNYVLKHATKQVKVPITGPYTLAEWSFNEFYQKKLMSGGTGLKSIKQDAKREFLLDIANELLRPNIDALTRVGATWIQVDEPALATRPEDVPLFVEAFNECTRGINCKLSVHICYSDYQSLYPHILELKNCSQLALEFANRDSGKHDAYEQLRLLKDSGDNREIGLGVVDVHVNTIEDPKIVLERTVRAAKFIEPTKIYLNPDCGLRTRPWDVTYAKLRSIVIGADLARKSLVRGS